MAKFQLTLFNSLSKKKEVFTPFRQKIVTLYTCGPTVYHHAHIGNLRAYIVSDILKRVLKEDGYSVKHVMNITDVGHLVSDSDEGEDKVEVAARKENKSAKEITRFYTESFKQDLKRLNILLPSRWARATDHIKEQIDLIKKLEKKGLTYRTSDGIYYDTEKFKDYRKLLGVSQTSSEDVRTRLSKNPEKKNPFDFALWKFSPKTKKRLQEWKSPWGIGFPGWHIECSAMALKYLGHPIDIHSGGIDHLTVHHPNEIAQSEGAGYAPFVRFWMHNEHLVLKSGKMSKSKSTGITIEELVKSGYDPMAFRYLCLNTHYRQKIIFSYEALKAASRALEHLRLLSEERRDIKGRGSDERISDFLRALNDDLNTPRALAVLWDAVKSRSLNKSAKRALLSLCERALGFPLTSSVRIPQNVRALARSRETARKNKNWKLSDEIRGQISALGFEVQDTSKGPQIIKKHQKL